MKQSSDPAITFEHKKEGSAHTFSFAITGWLFNMIMIAIVLATVITIAKKLL